MIDQNYTSEQIKYGNDLLRKSLKSNLKNRVILTASVNGAPNRDKILNAVINFDSFSEDNDPHGEHDGAIFEVDGKTYYFKIDYYDSNFEYGVDPYEEIPNRVLTIMLSYER